MTFLEYLRCIDRLQNVLCSTQRGVTSINQSLCDLPHVQLKLMPYMKDIATFIISGPDKKYAGMHKNLSDFGCQKIFCLGADVRKAIKNELQNLSTSGDMSALLMNKLANEMNELENISDEQTEVCTVNTAAFESYRNCHRGKKVVIVGDGETASYFKPILDAIYIALDEIPPREDITFDFRFSRPSIENGTGIATFADLKLNTTHSFMTSDGEPNQVIYQDICCHPVVIFGNDGGGGSIALRHVHLPGRDTFGRL